MKKATDNKQRYKDTFDQFQLSEEAYRQIRNMEETIMDTNFEKNKKRRAGFAVIVSLASLAVVFLSANGIVYAATGDNILEQFKQHVTFYINGEPTEADGIGKYGKDKDGNPYYEFKVDLPEEDSSGKEEVSVESNMEIGSFTINPAENENFKTSVKQENKKTYFVIEKTEGNPLKIDITKDFADGKASGTFEMEGGKYQYHITGDVEEYSVDVESLEDE